MNVDEVAWAEEVRRRGSAVVAPPVHVDIVRAVAEGSKARRRRVASASAVGLVAVAGLTFAIAGGLPTQDGAGWDVDPAASVTPTPTTPEGRYDPEAGDAYQYPITPDDRERWASYKTPELVEMLRIPEPTLKAISTSGLIDSMLDYPYIAGYISLWSTPLQGLEVARGQCDALQELLDRPDAGPVLLDFYVRGPEIEDSPINKTAFMVLLLGDDAILASLGFEGRAQLAETLIDDGGARAALEDFPGDVATWAVMGALVLDSPDFARLAQESEALRDYLETAFGPVISAESDELWRVFARELAETYGVEA